MTIPDIVPGSKVRINSQGHYIYGDVKKINNRPKPDGTIDQWWHWDLEYEILNPLHGHGNYGRWKQWVDGGDVSLDNEEDGA